MVVFFASHDAWWFVVVLMGITSCNADAGSREFIVLGLEFAVSGFVLRCAALFVSLYSSIILRCAIPLHGSL